jgi:hypothetical protein
LLPAYLPVESRTTTNQPFSVPARLTVPVVIAAVVA